MSNNTNNVETPNNQVNIEIIDLIPPKNIAIFDPDIKDAIMMKDGTHEAVDDFATDKIYPVVSEQIRNDIAALRADVETLKTKALVITQGTIVIWNKPANLIPRGWREYTPLRGRVPVGLNPNEIEFNSLGKIEGKKTHTLTIKEMPAHYHQQGGEGLQTIYYHNDGVRARYVDQVDWRPNGGNPAYINQPTTKVGGGEAHNNLQPYRVVYYIEYIGD